MGRKILVTGATGFIGGYIVDEALSRGYEVWAAVRSRSNRQWLTDARIRFITLDLTSRDALVKALRGHHFDYVVHAAGVTKSVRESDFFETNTEGTRHLADALIALGEEPRRFVFLSSLSVMGARRESQPYSDILDSDTPCPNTCYGRSKYAAEKILLSTSLNCVILRPTGVYGPRERDYFLMVKGISRHIDFSAGYRRQEITFIFVRDLVEAVFLALERGRSGGCYFLSDGNVYTSRSFSDLIRCSLGVGWLLRVRAPLWFLRLVTLVGEYAGRLTGRVTALNNDKYNILRQRNWRCDISAARRDLGFAPVYTLERGVAVTVKWYKDHGWL